MAKIRLIAVWRTGRMPLHSRFFTRQQPSSVWHYRPAAPYSFLGLRLLCRRTIRPMENSGWQIGTRGGLRQCRKCADVVSKLQSLLEVPQ